VKILQQTWVYSPSIPRHSTDKIEKIEQIFCIFSSSGVSLHTISHLVFQPWSKKNEVLDKRRDKKQRRAEKRSAAAATSAQSTKDEDDDFEAEYKLLKKLKSGKVSAAEFDAAIQLNDLQDDEG
jgi:hypothetical protein